MLVRVCSSNALSVASLRSAHSPAARATRKVTALGGATFALMLMASPAALAETCSHSPIFDTVGNVPTVLGFVGSTAGALTSAITTAGTAFLLQSTAFVSNPSNPKPDQQGSGIWVRSVGGEVTANAASTTQAALSSPGAAVNISGSINCDTKIHQSFAGVQLGRDIAKLNVNGWNFNFGTTAGYLEANGSTVGNNFVGGAFNSTVQAPFLGTYLTASRGGFFADVLVRGEYYQSNLDSPTLNIYNQKLNAHGVSIAGSAGYNYPIPNSKWFVEPSVGLIWSRTSVDPFTTSGVPLPSGGPAGIQGTLQINDIVSTIGRGGLRVGTTFETRSWIWQPFVAASVWHEFGKPATANYVSCTNCAFISPPVPGAPAVNTGTFTGTTVGTYGQYSLGMSGKLVNTGVVAFGRVDYREGPNLQGWDLTGGIRYDFTPGGDPNNKAIVARAPVQEQATVNWTGVYVGAYAGADYGKAKMSFAGVGSIDPSGAGFLGGAQAGYNRQFGQWVAGVEADWGWTNLNATKACLGPLAPASVVANTPLWLMNCHSDANWIATFTGRYGYVWDRALLYVKAGGAWAHETVSTTCNNGLVNAASFNQPGQQCANPAGAVSNGFSVTDNRLGWTVGYGVEYALTANWSTKVESNYMSFGNRNLTANDGTVINAGLRVMDVKVGVNYKLF